MSFIGTRNHQLDVRCAKARHGVTEKIEPLDRVDASHEQDDARGIRQSELGAELPRVAGRCRPDIDAIRDDDGSSVKSQAPERRGFRVGCGVEKCRVRQGLALDCHK